LICRCTLRGSPARRRELPRPLHAICAKATSEDRESRYLNVAELSEEVWRFLRSERVLAYPESLFERVQRFASKHRAAILLIAA
jgi:hypothetical protein